MRRALEKTYQGVPDPEIVIAVGACAISGGPFRDRPEVLNGANNFLPVDLYVPGGPPHPIAVLDGLLRLPGKIEDSKRNSPIVEPSKRKEIKGESQRSSHH